MSRDEQLGNTKADGWYVVGSSGDAAPRHVFHTQLLGQELAVWRDDEGRVNAWENRCPHRGSRLTIGINTGSELQCRYHGWKYGSGSGACTFIPAHPDMKPPGVIKATVFSCREEGGFIWASLQDTSFPAAPGETRVGTVLRSQHFDKPAATVGAALSTYGQTAGASDRNAYQVESIDPWTHILRRSGSELVVHLQPLDANACVLHAAELQPLLSGDQIEVLKWHAACMNTLRRALNA